MSQSMLLHNTPAASYQSDSWQTYKDMSTAGHNSRYHHYHRKSVSSAYSCSYSINSDKSTSSSETATDDLHGVFSEKEPEAANTAVSSSCYDETISSPTADDILTPDECEDDDGDYESIGQKSLYKFLAPCSYSSFSELRELLEQESGQWPADSDAADESQSSAGSYGDSVAKESESNASGGSTKDASSRHRSASWSSLSPLAAFRLLR
ncbi:hypothetical protein H4219_000173 [Mycoemilia scoparia]|uniref:Uncharacterized protein n=1 Tax=Mycoemilia scoparia TaxID=417184 RepID=A0A9W8A9I9_9FUNG|nr:hypothetical protein H4219_000173 [Mycoemilia scoparia]